MRRLATFSARGFWPVGNYFASVSFDETPTNRYAGPEPRVSCRASSFGLLVSFLTILLESLQLVVVKLYYNYILAAIKHFRKGLSKFFLMFEKLKITGLSSAIAIAGHMFANGP